MQLKLIRWQPETMSITALLAGIKDVTTPAYVLDEDSLLSNLETAARIRRQAGIKVVLATKAFAMFQAFPLMKPFLDGTTASGLYEARLGHEEFGKEVHVYSPAFDDAEIEGLLSIASHISFNSPSQFRKYYPVIKQGNPKVTVGMRINPELPLVEKEGYDKYNPCAPCSRMGSVRANIDEATLQQVEGLHFHILCENMAEDSVRLIDCVTEKFGSWLGKVKWVNFGGGHYINHPGYNLDLLINRLIQFKKDFPHLDVIMEPGGGLVYDTGYLVTTVLDITHNGKSIAVLDTSASTHIPDALEVPFRPRVYGSGEAGEKPHDYILGGRTCMTADVIGDYSFDRPLEVGDRLVFTEMMQYSFVKNTNFNGVPLPDLAILHKDGHYEVWQRFGYADFKRRLGKMI